MGQLLQAPKGRPSTLCGEATTPLTPAIPDRPSQATDSSPDPCTAARKLQLMTQAPTCEPTSIPASSTGSAATDTSYTMEFQAKAGDNSTVATKSQPRRIFQKPSVRGGQKAAAGGLRTFSKQQKTTATPSEQLTAALPTSTQGQVTTSRACRQSRGRYGLERRRRLKSAAASLTHFKLRRQ